MQKRDLFIIFFLGLTLVMVIWIIGLFVQQDPKPAGVDEQITEEENRKIKLLKSLRGAAGQANAETEDLRAEEKMNLLQSLRGR